jgi:hypothetical protein
MKPEQLVLHALDHVVAELHDAGADLHGVAAEEDELGGVLPDSTPRWR